MNDIEKLNRFDGLTKAKVLLILSKANFDKEGSLNKKFIGAAKNLINEYDILHTKETLMEIVSGIKDKKEWEKNKQNNMKVNLSRN
jgi:hypothetical protein